VEGAFSVNGWPERLGFAFRSILSYLLSRRSATGKIAVEASVAPVGDLDLTFRSEGTEDIFQPPPDPIDSIAVAQYRARQAAELAPESVELAVEQHKGKFEFNRGSHRNVEFLITLPPQSRLPGT
jgi:hypothetical protein